MMKKEQELIEKRKELEIEAREILELFSKWEEALDRGDVHELRNSAFKILELGDDFMKKLWTHVKPGEKLSEIAHKFIRGELG